MIDNALAVVQGNLALILLRDVQVFYPDQTLLEMVNLRVDREERLGLIGGNGCGKSSLLKILAGEMEPSAGVVERDRGLRVGYLPQSGLTYRGRTLWEEMLSALPDWLELKRKRTELRERISTLRPGEEEFEKCLAWYGELESRYEQQGGYTQESRLEKILDGLGFLEEDRHRPAGEFSAGWQMRIGMGKVLASEPDLLLLDEPTDHLDLEAKNWLEDYLKNVQAGYLLVSHDRHFLDNLVGRILEISNKQLELYVGNYRKYLIEKQKRTEEQEARHLKQEDKIRKMEEFIAKNRVRKDRARQAQSRIKALEKVERVARVRKEEEFRFLFPAPSRAPRVLATLDEVEKSFGPRVIFRRLCLKVERGERIAVVGPNGSGKSTLLRVLAGREPVQAGARLLEGGVSIGWFSQDAGSQFLKVASPLEAILELSPLMPQEKARGLLARFGFREDSVFKPVEALSGGERARLALAGLLLRRHHLLLLDEPTNHLDIKARQALLEALQAYQGTLVFVSHDRYFIQELGTRILEVQGGEIRSRTGCYEDFLAAKELGDQGFLLLSGKTAATTPQDRKADEAGQKEERQQERESRKKRQREEQRNQREIAGIEETIARLETELQELVQRMASPEMASSYPGLRGLHEQADKIRESLRKHYERWDELLNP